MTAPRFTISILCHNHLALTQKCLASVMRHSTDYELIVTDNGSTDGTAAWLAGIPNVQVVTNPTNAGFQEPNKHALSLARGEFLVLLNNDMEVCEGWLESLAKPFEGNPRMALTGAAGGCCRIDASLRGTGGSPPEYVEGSCLMVPTTLARRHGLFAPWLKFIYWEDTELSLRMRELGYEIALVPLATKHDHPSSTSKGIQECQDALVANTEAMKTRYAFYWRRRDLQRRILVRRLGAHGDVLLTTPVLRALRERYPQAAIELKTRCPFMIAGLDSVKLAKHGANWFDEFIDLDGAYERRPDLHIVQAFAEAAGVTVPKRWRLEMVASAADELWAERVSRGAKLALLHPGQSMWPSKNWPVAAWHELVAWLKARGYFTITVGDDRTPELSTDLHNASAASTPQRLYALAKRAKLFIGIDSMPQHVACAADTPSVVLFGPTNPKAIMRPGPRVISVQADVAKVPCVGEHGRRTKPITSVPCKGECINAITVQMVRQAVEQMEARAL